MSFHQRYRLESSHKRFSPIKRVIQRSRDDGLHDEQTQDQAQALHAGQRTKEVCGD